MAGPLWMPFYPADYVADTYHLTTLEHGAYMLLIMHYWMRGSLPQRDADLARLTRMDHREWGRHKVRLAEFFGPGWTHKRIDKERKSAEHRLATKAINGAAGGRANALKNHKVDVATATNSLEQNGSKRVHNHNHSNKKERETNNAREMRASSPWPSDAFNQFWTKYPHKVGRAACAAKLDKIRKAGEVPFERLMEGLDRYVHKRDDRPWCNPQTWLNQGRWDDEPAKSGAGGLSEAFDWLDDEIERRSSGASGGEYPRERFDAELRFDEPGGLFDPDYRH